MVGYKLVKSQVMVVGRELQNIYRTAVVVDRHQAYLLDKGFALFSASCTAAALDKEPAYSSSSYHSSWDLQHPLMTWVPSGEEDVD